MKAQSNYLLKSMNHELDLLKSCIKNESIWTNGYLMNQYMHRIFDVQEKIRILKSEGPKKGKARKEI